MKQMQQCMRLQRHACMMLLLACTSVAAEPNMFSFGVIAHTATASADDGQLRDGITSSDADNLAFVVVNGIKATSEPCSDKLFLRRKAVFENAKNGLIVSLAASDWTACTKDHGESVAIERLNRIRDLFFNDEFSFGGSRLPLVRQARMPRFRTYVENLNWDVGNTMFATLNLPANNNGYMAAAGRNNEFEDRMIANREWLHRLFGVAAQRNAAGIVLFCDADPMTIPDTVARIGSGARRDGFLEIRKQILAHSARFAGKVILVHGQGGRQERSSVPGETSVSRIVWHGNLGTVALASGWLKINVNPAAPMLFAVDSPASKTAAQ